VRVKYNRLIKISKEANRKTANQAGRREYGRPVGFYRWAGR
jgi:hypothetical protein